MKLAYVPFLRSLKELRNLSAIVSNILILSADVLSPRGVGTDSTERTAGSASSPLRITATAHFAALKDVHRTKSPE